MKMLQPKQPTPIGPDMIAKIIWLSLTSGMFFYVLVAVTMNKIQGIWMPSTDLSLFEQISLAATGMVLLSYVVHKKLVAPLKAIDSKKTGYMVVTWAMNESCVILGLIATIVSDSGNGFYLALNFAFGLVAQLIMYPRN
jgi:hypothetical protein